MVERHVVVGSPVGLHARPAALFSQAAAATGIPVTLTSASGRTVNAASILGVLSLGVDFGQTVTIAAEGERALDVLGDLAAMLERDLDLE